MPFQRILCNTKCDLWKNGFRQYWIPLIFIVWEKYFHRRKSVIQVWNDMTVNKWQYFEFLMHSFYVGLTDAISYWNLFVTLSLNFDFFLEFRLKFRYKLSVARKKSELWDKVLFFFKSHKQNREKSLKCRYKFTPHYVIKSNYFY